MDCSQEDTPLTSSGPRATTTSPNHISQPRTGIQRLQDSRQHQAAMLLKGDLPIRALPPVHHTSHFATPTTLAKYSSQTSHPGSRPLPLAQSPTLAGKKRRKERKRKRTRKVYQSGFLTASCTKTIAGRRSLAATMRRRNYDGCGFRRRSRAPCAASIGAARVCIQTLGTDAGEEGERRESRGEGRKRGERARASSVRGCES